MTPEPTPTEQLSPLWEAFANVAVQYAETLRRCDIELMFLQLFAMLPHKYRTEFMNSKPVKDYIKRYHP